MLAIIVIPGILNRDLWPQEKKLRVEKWKRRDFNLFGFDCAFSGTFLLWKQDSRD
jgi:hypothetical protein